MIASKGGTAMTRILEAVYEDGVLKPLTDPCLTEHQRVIVEIRLSSESSVESELEGWHRVYEGLSDAEVAEVEKIALDRSRFFREP
jgi:predicted DNA-binding antitoxin AbrB/MazE fold protein